MPGFSIIFWYIFCFKYAYFQAACQRSFEDDYWSKTLKMHYFQKRTRISRDTAQCLQTPNLRQKSKLGKHRHIVTQRELFSLSFHSQANRINAHVANFVDTGNFMRNNESFNCSFSSIACIFLIAMDSHNAHLS